jgi:glutamine synthetase
MSSHKRRSLARSFVDRHGLWSEAQARAAAAVDKAIVQKKLELVRFSFPDQHGVLRGKTLVAGEASQALRNGVTMTSTLLAKDTAHRTVFPVFEPGAGIGVPEMGGAGNFIMVADPQTFRTLPWADNTGWVLCDSYFANGRKVPIATRHLYCDALAKLRKAGFDYAAGIEIEFHLFKIEDRRW